MPDEKTKLSAGFQIGTDAASRSPAPVIVPGLCREGGVIGVFLPEHTLELKSSLAGRGGCAGGDAGALHAYGVRENAPSVARGERPVGG